MGITDKQPNHFDNMDWMHGGEKRGSGCDKDHKVTYTIGKVEGRAKKTSWRKRQENQGESWRMKKSQLSEGRQRLGDIPGRSTSPCGFFENPSGTRTVLNLVGHSGSGAIWFPFLPQLLQKNSAFLPQCQVIASFLTASFQLSPYRGRWQPF